MNPNKVVLMSDQYAQELQERLRESGWHMFSIGGAESGKSFFEIARSLPSDPPIGTYPNWDGFADSLSGGLIDFCYPSIAIVWYDADLLKKSDPPSFILAIGVFEQVAANQWLEQKRGNTKNRILIFILGSGPLFEGKITPKDIQI